MPNSFDRPYPYNLIEAVFGENLFEDIPEPPDMKASVEYAVATLTEREAGMVHQRYRDGNSLQQIGESYGVSYERVRQVIAKALRKLLHPSRAKMLRYGVKGAYELAYAERTKKIEEASYLSGYDAGYKQCVEELGEEKSKSVRKISPLDSMTVEELDISVRSYNCLKRAGLDTVGDILDMDMESLMKIRNLGKKSYIEIIDKLQDLGYDCHHLNDYGKLIGCMIER